MLPSPWEMSQNGPAGAVRPLNIYDLMTFHNVDCKELQQRLPVRPSVPAVLNGRRSLLQQADGKQKSRLYIA